MVLSEVSADTVSKTGRLDQPEDDGETTVTFATPPLSSRALLASVILARLYNFLFIMAAVASPVRERRESRPANSTRHPTAPTIMSVNGHFANMGEKPTAEQYEHGIQVINEDQEFKYSLSFNHNARELLTEAVPLFLATFPLRKYPQLASTTT